MKTYKKGLIILSAIFILPAFACTYHDIQYNYEKVYSRAVTTPYHSANETPLSKNELKAFLHHNNLLQEDASAAEHPDERYWPDGNCRIDQKKEPKTGKQSGDS